MILTFVGIQQLGYGVTESDEASALVFQKDHISISIVTAVALPTFGAHLTLFLMLWRQFYMKE